MSDVQPNPRGRIRGAQPCGVLLALLLCVTAALPAPAGARVVGMVVDDSRSMLPSFNQALFAAQLLIGSLGADDRLLVARLNAQPPRIDEVPPGERAAYMARMRNDWKPGQNTPYAPLARMLERIVAETAPGEDADLLVFADGNFQGVPADPRADFEAIKARFRGARLQVYFVQLPGEAAEIDLRGPLLGVFNGSPRAGARDIETPAQVFPGLADVIAQIAGADPLDADNLVRRSGAGLRFRLPFAVRRVVAVTTGDARVPPAAWRSATFPLAQDPPLGHEPAMAREDPGSSTRLQAKVVHLLPPSPLAAGVEHGLTFDRPLRPLDRVLFEADLRIALAVHDADGQPLERDADGRLRVAAGQGLEVRARFLDRVGDGWRPLDLTGTGLVPGFTLYASGGVRPMDLDPATGEASLRLGPYGAPGQHTLSVEGRLKGLTYLRGDDLVIEVVPVEDVRPRLTARPLIPCPGCGPGRAELPLVPGPGGADALAIEASVSGARAPADYVLALDAPLPAGLALLDASGKPVLGADARGRLRLAPGEPLPLTLRYDDAWAPEAAERLGLTLSATGARLRGSDSLVLELVPVAAPLDLVADGHTGADQGRPFSLPVTGIDGEQGVYLAARGLVAPLDPTHLKLDSDPDWPLALRLDGQRILLTPERRWWGTCLNRAGGYPYRLDYANPSTRQRASIEGAIEVTPVPWWRRCWMELAMLVGALLVLWKLICKVRSDSFPRYSQVLKIGPDATSWAVARTRPLHSWLRMPLLCGRERVVVYGLQLVARTGGGVGIVRDAKGSGPHLYHTGLGEPLPRAFEARRTDELPWGWNQPLVDDETGTRYVLVQDIRRPPEGRLP